ncbi:MAG: rRNA maturation RNase YbeY [Eubacteriales bacterium]|mgnify:CR=1 FL=1|nr:rRNA maturation RNase YbeY [Eubacteriales bacterium]MDD4422598.1 rRNA maturation RNase YbeY [Eubacteriales bacterium]
MTRIYYENLTGEIIPQSYITLIKRIIRTCVASEYPNHKFEVGVTICDNAYIRKINKAHRGVDKATDVLSFPFLDFDTPEINTLLGDIIISIDKAKEQAAAYEHSLKRELCFLAAHATLHLLGYDHEDESERENMEKRQRELLDSFGIKR